MPGLIGPMIFGLGKMAINAINKPKHNQPDLSYVDRYMNNLKSDIAGKKTYELMMRNASNAIGAQAGKQMSGVDAASAQHGTSGSGQDAKAKIAINAAGDKAIGEASNEAMQVQLQENAMRKERLAEAEMIRERVLAEEKQRYDTAIDDWKRSFTTIGVETALQVGSNAIQDAADWKSGLDRAKITDENMTMDGFKALGGSPDVALAKQGYDRGLSQGNNFMKLLEPEMLKELSPEVIGTLFQSGQVSEPQAMQLIQAKFDTMKESDVTQTLFNMDTGNKETYVNGKISRYDQMKPTDIKHEEYWEPHGDGKTEVLRRKNPISGDWEQIDERPRFTPPPKPEDKAKMDKLEAEREWSVMDMDSYLDYRIAGKTGDTTKLEDIKGLMTDGVDQIEMKELGGKVNEYINSISEEDLNKLDANEADEIMLIINMSGGEKSKLEAYREMTRNKLMMKYKEFVTSGNFDPNKALLKY